jgi:hypothetical protein
VSDQQPISFTPEGPPRTVLAPEPPEVVDALERALALDDPTARRDAVATVAARWPRSLDAWARLGQLGRDDTESYAYFRVGYHRGLDSLRASGWRGSGYVRWADQTNRGFLRALRGLRDTAARIGEDDEAERCAVFLQQLDPSGVPDAG